jgi:hypothetical protein
MKQPRRFWQPEDLRVLRRLYPHNDTAWIAGQLDRTVGRVYAMASKLGLHKTPEFLAAQVARVSANLTEGGRAFRFVKGQVSHNKGRKGYCAPGCEAGWFPKGNRPHTWKPVGSYRVNADGYLDRKVSETGYGPRDWVAVHRLVWVEYNGPIPPGHAVAFLPGRRTTELEKITIDALELVSRRELMRRNTVHNLPKPIASLVQLRGALVRQINRRTKA